MASGEQSSCNNHPGVVAAGRCKQCGKPFCTACQVVGATGQFCSDGCKQQHEVFVGRAAKLDQMRSGSGIVGKLMDRFRKLAVFTIGALIIGIVLHFFGVNVPILSDFLEANL